ncbi:MAG TPA: DUF4333 domain-containing protein [Mycobacterium sp.]
MTTTIGVRVAVGMLIGVATLQLAGCTKTIKPEGAAQSVVDVVSKETGFKPTDVNCPTGVGAKVGGEFDCHFTGPEGPYVAHMRITKVDGDNVEFDIRTQRS